METITERSTKVERQGQTMKQNSLEFKQTFKKPVLVSKHFNRLQLRGFIKTGDIIIPGDHELPAFSQTAFLGQVDRMLDYMNKDDLAGLKVLMTLFATLPAFVIRTIMAISKENEKFPDLIGTPLRQIYIGTRGLYFTLYYSNLNDEEGAGQMIHNTIGFDAQVTIRDEKGQVDNTALKQTENPNLNDIQKIYADANEAQRKIRKLSIKQRLRYISALKEVILSRQEEIISVIQKDTGKSRSDALFSEIFAIMDHLDFLEKESVKALSDQKIKTPLALMGKKSRVFYEPLGTVLVISPWNYPFYQAIVPVTTSFVTGNATLYKPSEYTPLRGLVEDVLNQAGFERDWVQVIYGNGETGRSLIAQRPDKIFFTGSVATGKKIMAQAAEDIIPVELELGGKDPMIVFDDIKIDRAVAAAAWGAFTNTGQSCTSVERLYIHENIYEEFKQKLVALTKTIVQKIDSDGNADIGAMTTTMQKDIVARQLQDALDKGARELTGHSWDKESMLIPPMILEGTDREMLINQEETFGPLLTIFPFADEAQVVAMANASEYGLSASVWSANNARAQRVARSLITGNVSINNVMLTEGNHYLPFGGTKLSGIGRYKGVFGLHNFSNIKSIIIDANSSKIEANWYPYTTTKYKLFTNLTAGLFSRGISNFIKFAVNGLKVESYSNKVGKKGRED